MVWALSEAQPADGAIAVIGGSHRSSLPAPHDVLSGEDTMGLAIVKQSTVYFEFMGLL